MTATQCARTVVSALLQLGVEHVVLCPGSRSAPLAFALEQAARDGNVELHVRIDERSAGFVALGLAKASGRVVPIVTTSGTAVGNLLPAVMEASHSGVPIMVLSADRPATMLHTGANQTTDQARLFERFTRGVAEISGGEGTPQAWAFQVSRLVAAALGVRTRDPGPVQLNIAFAEPLVPTDDEWPEVTPTRVTPPVLTPNVVRIPSPGTVVLVGDCAPAIGDRAAGLAMWSEVPILSEPSGNARFGPAIRTYRLLLDTELAGEITRVLLFGHPTLSRPVSRLLARDDVEVIAVTGGARWVDPGVNVARVIDAVEIVPDGSGWDMRWIMAGLELGDRIDAELGDDLSGLTVAATVWQSLTSDDTLVIGSSNPIRDLDLAPVAETAPRAYANRGLAGIDGTLATAQGIALIHGPTTVLLGDLTFLHDVGSLLIGPLERSPDLRVVVVNDDGGSIFHLLEQGAEEYAGAFERIFGTPTGVRIAPLAEAYGWRHRGVTDPATLRTLLAEPISGREIVEIRVSRDDRRAQAARLVALRDTLT